jgi:hypothetical protein
MSTMSQTIPSVEDLVPHSDAQRTVDSKIASDVSRLNPLRAFAGLLVLPLLMLLAMLGFLVVLADFSWFRLRNLRDGRPQPKGLWEF